MERERKWRAIEKKTGKLIYSDVIGRTAFWQMWFQGELDSSSIQDFIGCQDSRKKDIYEGDQIRFTANDGTCFRGIITFDDNSKEDDEHITGFTTLQLEDITDDVLDGDGEYHKGWDGQLEVIPEEQGKENASILQ